MAYLTFSDLLREAESCREGYRLNPQCSLMTLHYYLNVCFFQDICECLIFYADQMCQKVEELYKGENVNDKEIQGVSII
jgi:hypothetical protein